jgi:hypothetical protein
MKTHCKWIEDDEQMLVNPDGQVLPCCYLSNYFTVDKRPPIPVEMIKDGKVKKEYVWDTFHKIEDQLYHIDFVNLEVSREYLFQEYEKRKDKLNIFTNDLKDILNDEWFTKILPESWESENTIAGPCKEICTSCLHSP